MECSFDLLWLNSIPGYKMFDKMVCPCFSLWFCYISHNALQNLSAWLVLPSAVGNNAPNLEQSIITATQRATFFLFLDEVTTLGINHAFWSEETSVSKQTGIASYCDGLSV